MSKRHTPGPWILAGKTTISNEGGDFCLANVGTYSIEADEAEANAKLIATAPELLAALESFLRAPSIGSNGPGSSTIVVQDFNFRAARAAIAKAKGEQA